MKSEENVQRLVGIFDTDEDSLQDIVFEAHADARNIRHSGIATGSHFPDMKGQRPKT